MRSVLKNVMFVGRATTFVVGLAVILALTVGVAGSALGANGANLLLGKTNTANAITQLVGTVAGPSLQIDNNSTDATATALDLQVEAGKAPMKVNSVTKVANLNADKLDGMDAEQLQGFSTLRVSTTDVNSLAGDTGFGLASCQAGEQAVSGGVELQNGDIHQIFYQAPGGIPVVDPTTGQLTGWRATWLTQAAATVRVYAVCAS
jgi:hypothetical protein